MSFAALWSASIVLHDVDCASPAMNAKSIQMVDLSDIPIVVLSILLFFYLDIDFDKTISTTFASSCAVVRDKE